MLSMSIEFKLQHLNGRGKNMKNMLSLEYWKKIFILLVQHSILLIFCIRKS